MVVVVMNAGCQCQSTDQLMNKLTNHIVLHVLQSLTTTHLGGTVLAAHAAADGDLGAAVVGAPLAVLAAVGHAEALAGDLLVAPFVFTLVRSAMLGAHTKAESKLGAVLLLAWLSAGNVVVCAAVAHLDGVLVAVRVLADAVVALTSVADAKPSLYRVFVAFLSAAARVALLAAVGHAHATLDSELGTFGDLAFRVELLASMGDA